MLNLTASVVLIGDPVYRSKAKIFYSHFYPNEIKILQENNRIKEVATPPILKENERELRLLRNNYGGLHYVIVRPN